MDNDDFKKGFLGGAGGIVGIIAVIFGITVVFSAIRSVYVWTEQMFTSVDEKISSDRYMKSKNKYDFIRSEMRICETYLKRYRGVPNIKLSYKSNEDLFKSLGVNRFQTLGGSNMEGKCKNSLKKLRKKLQSVRYRPQSGSTVIKYHMISFEEYLRDL